MWISIPYGAIKRKLWKHKLWNQKEISIPYGAIKRLYKLQELNKVKQFQFLMVRLKDYDL